MVTDIDPYVGYGPTSVTEPTICPIWGIHLNYIVSKCLIQYLILGTCMHVRRIMSHNKKLKNELFVHVL